MGERSGPAGCNQNSIVFALHAHVCDSVCDRDRSVCTERALEGERGSVREEGDAMRFHVIHDVSYTVSVKGCAFEHVTENIV
jgi:hypothetical protein